MDHVLSLSYGKDSLACLGAIEELGWPLDRIIHAEVWATDTIPGDFPVMVEFKAKADRIIKEKWGIEVEHIRADRSYQDIFYKKRERGKHIGQIHGFPMNRGAWCNDRLKTNALDRVKRGCVTYVGIAADEPNRLERLTDTRKSPLAEAGWTEQKCLEWCEQNDLLSPIYTSSARGGCWFCHNQPVDQLRLLRKNHPELWDILLKWDLDSPVSFKSNGHTVHDYDRRFTQEDKGLLKPGDKNFRWKLVEDATSE